VAVDNCPAVGYPVTDLCTIHVFKAVVTGGSGGLSQMKVSWNVHKSIGDPVHHHEFGVLSAELEGRKPKVGNHLAGAAGSPVVASDKSCRSTLYSL